MSDVDNGTDIDHDTDLDGDTEEEFIPVQVVSTPHELEAAGLGEGAPALTTVLARLLRAGISAERAEGHLASGTVMVDGERVTDPNTPAAPPARIVLLPA